jgi:hypothetical protein
LSFAAVTRGRRALWEWAAQISEWATHGLQVGDNHLPRRDGKDVSADRFPTFHVQNYFIAPRLAQGK